MHVDKRGRFSRFRHSAGLSVIARGHLTATRNVPSLPPQATLFGRQVKIFYPSALFGQLADY
jgi:hypothetical protein